MKKITVFTPTYNRAYLLPRLYKSLCNQTNKEFIWLVIDDGSTDNTKELIEQWKAEDKITIQYHWKENGGMHTGHNAAYKLIETELNMCIDSDDLVPQCAIKKILNFWEYNKEEKYAGILGLDAFENGNIVSNKKFPSEVKSGKYSFLKRDFGIVGDIKFVYRTDIIKKYPEYPVFKDEKLTPLGYKYRMIDQDYDMLFLNEILCQVEYLGDGSSNTIYKQYFQSPRGFKHSRIYTMKYSATLKDKVIQAGHYIKESIIANDYNIFRNNPNKLVTIICIPLGIIMYYYFKLKK